MIEGPIDGTYRFLFLSFHFNINICEISLSKWSLIDLILCLWKIGIMTLYYVEYNMYL